MILNISVTINYKPQIHNFSTRKLIEPVKADKADADKQYQYTKEKSHFRINLKGHKKTNNLI